ncbi:hypothetical protein A5320_02650 [Rheinheimera sp. SA_1]|uniref:condensation domain-containing protein n=1 Tax=Rheinheimera sp. SA_1 TaxID=1827365 RepID=UPI0007FDA6AE|nr:condensation domain-containing protein [Rheinheimera sp. SA_1]OBP16327.1 hypothetical protein A5320_02650 [Rheinheimera sp. SA_1]
MDKKELQEKLSALSPKEQALLLQRFKERSLSSAMSGIQPCQHDATEPVAVSFAQQGLWFMEQMEGASHKYNMASAYHLKGALDCEALRRALAAIYQRHNALRTVFFEVSGEPRQLVQQSPLPFQQIDLSALTAEAAEAQVKQKLTENSRHLFDLSRGPLVRFELVRLHSQHHLLLLNFHHIIFDGYSKGLFLKELGIGYAHYKQGGTAVELPPLPIQYRDYAVWQRETLAGTIGEQLQYWQHTLADAPALLNLPVDDIRPALPSGRGRALDVAVSKDLTRRFLQLGRQHSVTPFISLLALFSVVLSYFSEEQDILVGTPVDNRNKPELNSVIGYFLNTLVVRNQIDLNQSFTDVLASVKTNTIQAFSHQDIPFVQVTEHLNHTRSLSITPLFQVMMVLQNKTSSEVSLAGIDIAKYGAETTTSKYDLYLTFRETDDGLRGWLTYNSDIFAEQTVTAILQTFYELMESVVIAPALSLCQFLTPATVAMPVPMPQSHGVETLLGQLSTLPPEHQVLADPESGITAGQLSMDSDRLLTLMTDTGVLPGEFVVIEQTNLRQDLIALVACAKLGCCVVLDSASIPIARGVQEQLTVLTGNISQTGLAWPRRRIQIEELHSVNNRQVTVVRSHPARMMYVRLDGAGALGLAVHDTEVFSQVSLLQSAVSGASPVIPLLASLADFDRMLLLWFGVVSGSVVRPVALGICRDIFALVDYCQQQQFDWLLSSGHLLEELVAAYPELHEDWPRLNRLICRGSRWVDALVTKLRAALPEATILALLTSHGGLFTQAVSTLPSEPPQRLRFTALPGRELSCRDEQRNLCLPEKVGLLCSTGGVAPTPVGAVLTTGWPAVDQTCCSDVLAKASTDGTLRLQGRKHQQHQIRGFSVNLDQVENALCRLNGVKTAAAVYLADERGHTGILAFVVGTQTDGLQPERLKATVKRQVAEYFAPDWLLVVPDLPRSANGEIDYRWLPVPDLAELTRQHFEPPQGHTEQLVARLWQQLLKVDAVGRTHNFFDLGGHSLLAMQLIDEIKRRFGLPVTTQDLFNNLTLQDFCSCLETMMHIREHNAVATTSAETFDTFEY